MPHLETSGTSVTSASPASSFQTVSAAFFFSLGSSRSSSSCEGEQAPLLLHTLDTTEALEIGKVTAIFPRNLASLTSLGKNVLTGSKNEGAT